VTEVQPRPTPQKTRATSLRQEARFFWTQRNPRIMAAALVLALGARLVVGDWSLDDVWVAMALIAAQPFVEWVLHIMVLHYRPRTLLGRELDFLLARKHREHHADPTVVDLIFIPLPVLLRVIPLGALLSWLVLPTTAMALTAICVGLVLLLGYEWTHYLVHSAYRPKTRVYRAIWRAHRLHHYKNEQYWFGVTNPAADHLLGTFPDPADVPTSPTARNLHQAR
jgi:sterol desaturase/sphingolipid hydroxylase (fatty acid hydroxylase superfamily)